MRGAPVAAVAVLLGAVTAAGASLAPATAARAGDEADLDAYPATRNRPLFSPTRRPPPAVRLGDAPNDAPLAAPPPPPARPNLQLSGVIVGGGQGLALVRRAGDPRLVSVGVGATIDGWTVSEIAPRAITLRRDALSAVVALPEPGK